MKQSVDAIFFNGVVYTVDQQFSVAEAFAVDKGKIVAVGKSDEILNAYKSEHSTDLKGAPVYPGFIDAHCHFFGYGTGLLKCDLTGTNSFDEVLNKVEAYSKTEIGKSFEWIVGRGWDQNDWPLKEFPTKEKLDVLFPGKPVLLYRVDGHAALANQKALNAAGVNENSKVSGGEVVVKDGKLTGVLVDNAIDLVDSKIPKSTNEQYVQALMNAQKDCFSVGLTTVDDAGLGKETIELIKQMSADGRLKMRMYIMLSDNDSTLNYYLPKGIYKTEGINIRAIKTYADGALGSRGAKLLEPYSDKPDHTGFLLHPVSHFDSLAGRAVASGFQLCTHAIGDSGARMILQTYAHHLEKNNDKRWRVEHSQVVQTDDQKYFADYKIIPSVQPTHATSDMYWAAERLGPTRVKYAYAFNDLLKQSGTVALGTDFPVENINPLYTFYAAVERKDLKGYPEGGFQPENKLSREDALKGMTIWAAHSNFEEQEKGSIEKGKLADFVILDADIMKITSEKIPQTKVAATYLGGSKVY